MPRKTDKKVAIKSQKKIRSFNIDERVYSGLMEMLEASGAQVTLSVLVDEFLRKLYIYLLEADGALKKANEDMLSAVVYDCMNIEYFRESNKENKRIWNIICSHRASREGLSLTEYMQKYPEMFLD